MRTDLKCPECGYTEGIYIRARATVRVAPNGDMTLETSEPVEWSEGSPCECGECAHSGRVRDFRWQEELADEVDQD